MEVSDSVKEGVPRIGDIRAFQKKRLSLKGKGETSRPEWEKLGT